jgi:hypothetical protein
MASERTRQRIARLVAPRLGPTEELVATGPAWAAPLRRRVPVLLVGRKLHLVALTDRRLLVFRRQRRRRSRSERSEDGGSRPTASHGRGGGGELALAKTLASLRVVRVRSRRPMMALRIQIGDGRVLLLEVRPRDHALGRSIADAIRTASAAAIGEAPDDGTGPTDNEP